jgi:SAM-dependent methyltransferase
MLREKFEYYNTEYDPKSPLTAQPFTAFADFENLAYQDEQLDYVIATDVFEHVRQDDKAFSEVFRVLRKNGAFIMTVPYDHEWEETLVRVKPEGDKDIFLLPPEYHGGGGQTLTYRKYGRDLLKRLQQHGFSVGYIDIEVPRFCIPRQFVFIGVKSSAIDLGKFYSVVDTGGSEHGPKASPLILFRLFVTLKYNMLSVRHFVPEFIRKIKSS